MAPEPNTSKKRKTSDEAVPAAKRARSGRAAPATDAPATKTAPAKKATAAQKAAATKKAAPKNSAAATKKAITKIAAAPKKPAAEATAQVNGTKTTKTKKSTTTTKAKAPATTDKKPVATKKAAAVKKPVAAKKAAPKTAATKKAAPKKVAPEEAVAATNGDAVEELEKAQKRKTIDESEEDDEEEEKPAKKPKTIAHVPTDPKKPTLRKTAVINEAPKDILHVFVFGENSSGELGLGAEGKVIDVKRPRLNPFIQKVGPVKVAVGGMHMAVLTADNKIYTCGVNDQGALGRDTAGYEGNFKNVDAAADSDDDDDNNGLNPYEATPAEISLDTVPVDTVFTDIACGDSITVAITDDGHVYGCGTFRSNEGILGFTAEVHVQKTMTLIPELKKIKRIECGANHVLALDSSGNVFAWGSGQQNQLGRRVVERTRYNGLKPREFGLPRKAITDVFCGSYHSFALDNKGNVWSWGLNSFHETGVSENDDEDETVILKPAKVTSLAGKGVIQLSGGAHHSLAVTKDGRAFGFGRVDGCQLGIKTSDLKEEDVVKDERGMIRILKTPTVIPIPGKAVFASAGPDHGIVINDQGRAYSFGFSANYQTAQGTDKDVAEATLIDNTATREEKLIYAECGGQFGALASVKKA